MPWVYILKSIPSNRFYIGATNNLVRRLDEHNKGLNFSTKPYRPWKLVYIEKYQSLSEARTRERFIKSLKSRKIIERHILRSPDVRLKPQSGSRFPTH